MAERTIKAWEGTLEDLDRRLREWYGRFDASFVRRSRSARRWFKRPDARELNRIEDELRAELGEDVLLEAAALFDQLGTDYLAALPGERARIRARIGSNDAIFRFFWSFVLSQPELIEAADEGEARAQRLRLALAAASIHDLRNDIEAVDEVLGRIWLAAEEGGLDPAPEIQSVAEVSNAATGGGAAHFQKRLADFERSVYFRDFVQPQRARERRTKKAS